MIAIVLQYHGGDYFRAMELARFIAQLEDVPRGDVRFMFFGRWDAPSPDTDTLAALRRKFLVTHAHTSKYKWTGWPAGPNGIAREVLETAPNWLAFKRWPDVKALLMLEPDCVPFARGWLDQMVTAWRRRDGAWQVGAWRNSGAPEGHINGNCLIRSDIRDVLPLQVITQHLAWDCAIAPLMRDHWRESKLFANHFQSVNATRNGIHPSAVLVHGYKDNSAMKLAREILL